MVAEVIFMLLGFILGQIRTLQRLSFLANLAIWLNVIVIVMTWVFLYLCFRSLRVTDLGL
jgi:hypothetical protein